MWKQAVFQPGNKDDGKLEAFGIVYGQQADLSGFVQRVRLRYEGGVIQKLGESLRALGGIRGGVDQFFNVAQAAFGFRRAIVEHSAISGALDDCFESFVDRTSMNAVAHLLHELSK